MLLVGPPCAGKTTLLRDLCSRITRRSKVAVVDTSMEIGGAGHMPHPSLGPVVRLHVPERRHQGDVMLEAVMNHSPGVLLVGEIGSRAEVQAARDIARRGVTMIATVQASSVEQLLSSPELARLLGGKATFPIGDTLAMDHAARTGGMALDAKMQAMRLEPPVFRSIVLLCAGEDPLLIPDAVEFVDSALMRLR